MGERAEDHQLILNAAEQSGGPNAVPPTTRDGLTAAEVAQQQRAGQATPSSGSCWPWC
jgi:hypothetical protein